MFSMAVYSADRIFVHFLGYTCGRIEHVDSVAARAGAVETDRSRYLLNSADLHILLKL